MRRNYAGPILPLGSLLWVSNKESACKAGDTGNAVSLREWQPIPVILLEKAHGQRSLAGYSAQGCKESDMAERACVRILSL